MIVEIGGTVGDIESLPFLEAIRQFRHEIGRENAIFIHLTLVPYIAAAGEVKTKPTQHSVRELMEIGIQPDILICRTERPLSDEIKRKIALFCNVEFGAVIESRDVPTIYEIPLALPRAGTRRARSCRSSASSGRAPDLAHWREMVQRVVAPHERVRIAVVGKYTDFVDSYKSVQEALIHGGIANDVGVDISVDRRATGSPTRERAREILARVSTACSFPAASACAASKGWSRRSAHARETRLPFFGICLGMQTAIIEFARNVLRARRQPLERVRARVRQPGHLADGIAAARHRHGRHDAPRRVSVPPRARHRARRRSTASPR